MPSEGEVKLSNLTFRTVCLDFDGVLNTYDGWKGSLYLFEPRPGAKEFVKRLQDLGYHVVIHSTRQPEAIRTWLEDHAFPRAEYIPITKEKPLAIVYLDDRGLTFTGNFNLAFEQIQEFRTHWEKETPA